MKRICIIFSLVIFTLASCGNQSSYHKKSRVNKFSHLEKKNSKHLSKKTIPPTELMQVGLGNKKKYNDDNGSNSEAEPNLDNKIPNDEREIADNFIDDGSYIGVYKIGKPYEVSGVTYQPQEYNNFEEVGNASWYGDDFHGKKTANGEIYHKGDMTAAHPTLPLPSMVRITNLDNGKSVKVRVNDRGPFTKKRIVDVSQKAAEELGFRGKGTAKVKLEFLKEDTEEMLQKLGINQ